MSRLNAYKALSSPSLIALTSKDPILTAFKLSNQLKSLSKMESQFCKEYTVLREQVQGSHHKHYVTIIRGLLLNFWAIVFI